MAVPSKGNNREPQLIEIERLKEQHKTSEAIYQGLLARERWKPGKQVTEAEYQQALNRFLSGPISGKKVNKHA